MRSCRDSKNLEWVVISERGVGRSYKQGKEQLLKNPGKAEGGVVGGGGKGWNDSWKGGGKDR